MKAVLKATGEQVFVLDNVSAAASPYYTVLFPFATASRAGAFGDVRPVRKDRVRLVKATIGLDERALKGNV